MGLVTVFPHPKDLVRTLNWVFENQQIVSGILTQPISRKQYAIKRKGSLKKGSGSYLYIHLYYRSDMPTSTDVRIKPDYRKALLNKTDRKFTQV